MLNKNIATKFFMVILVTLFLTGCDMFPPQEEEENKEVTVSDVVMTVIDGELDSQIKVKLKSETPNTTIRYTLDNSEPTQSNGTIYTNPFIINNTTTIRALAYVNNEGTVSKSRVVSENFTFKTGNPRIIPGGHTFSGSLLVSIISATDNATIMYTTDGTIPTSSNGNSYTGSFTITDSTTVRAIAFKNGYNDSEMTFEEFTSDDSLPQVSGIIWKGVSNEYPASPEINWAFYHSDQGKTFIYDGNDWSTIASDGTDGVDGTNGTDGLSIVWKGELSTAPSSPETNWVYLNTTDDTTYIYNGSSWNVMVKQGSNGTDGQNGLDGVSIVWKGSLNTAPSNPGINWGYYNTTEGKSYIWTGSAWSLIAQDGGLSEVVAPIMVPGGTTYNTPTAVTIFTTTPGATIRYTTNGDDPTESTGTVYLVPVLIENTTTLKSVAYKNGMTTSGINSMTYTINRVENPTFSVPGGEYQDIQTVTVSTETTGTTLYYTIDGSDPSTSNYEGYGNTSVNVSVNKTMDLKVIGVKDNYLSSNIVTESYQVVNVTAPPVFSLTDQYYTEAQSLTITTETTGAVIYYTTNGTTPSNSNYAGSGTSINLDITSSMTVKAIAVKTDYKDSTITTQTYTITGKLADPVLSIAEGTYAPNTELEITTSGHSPTIYYTLDGRTPTAVDYDGSGQTSVTITLTDSATIKAISIKDHWLDSEVVSAAYNITDSAAEPTVDVDGGLYGEAKSILLSTNTTGATIYYTTDGTTPSAVNYEGSGVDNASLTIDQSVTLKAIAIKDGLPDSTVLEVVYEIDTEAPVIALSGPSSLILDLNQTFTDPGATATDNRDGDISTNISTVGDVNTAQAGTYTITYSVSDEVGNAATPVTRTVEIVASTVLPLTIRDNTTDFHTLDLARSPYSVAVGNCRIDVGVSVTIEPGVVIKFAPDTQLYVDGELIAIGTEENRITFTAGGADYWNNVEISNLATEPTFDLVSGEYVSGTSFQYCDFENGGNENDRGMLTVYQTGIYINQSNFSNSKNDGFNFQGEGNESVIIENNVFFENNESGAYISSPKIGRFSNNTLIRNGYYNDGVLRYNRYDKSLEINTVNSSLISYTVENNTFNDSNLYYHGSGSSNDIITNNTFTGFISEIEELIEAHYITEFTNNKIENCKLKNDAESGQLVLFNNIDNITGNSIINNETESYLIHLYYLADKNISNNIIVDNTYKGLRNFNSETRKVSSLKIGSYSNDRLKINNNNIVNPTFDFEIQIQDDFIGSENKVDASGCWWGQNDEAFIRERIWDYYDDGTKNIVEYYPWSETELIFE